MTAADMGYWHRRAQLPAQCTFLQSGSDCLLEFGPLRDLVESEKTAMDRALDRALKHRRKFWGCARR